MFKYAVKTYSMLTADADPIIDLLRPALARCINLHGFRLRINSTLPDTRSRTMSIPAAGDLVNLDAARQPMLVLGSHEGAVELLEKQSAIYSDRVYSPMVEL